MQSPRLIAALLVLFAAAGVPLAQVLQLAEVAPAAVEGKRESAKQPQYRLVLASGIDSQASKAPSEKKSAKDNDVRLLKVLDEQWESSARVQFDSAALPVESHRCARG